MFPCASLPSERPSPVGWIRSDADVLRDRPRASYGRRRAFLGVGGFINHNTRVANGGDDRRRSAQIELRYKALKSQPQPEAVTAGIEVSVYPERRTIETDGRLVLRNSTSEPIGQILVHVPADVTLERLSIAEGKAVRTRSRP